MESLATWDRFVTKRRNAPPLAYLSGMRVPLKKGVSCIVHAHNAIEIVYHPRGRGVTRLQQSENISFTEGAVVVYAPFEPHDQVLECEGEDLCVTLALPADQRGLPKQGFTVPRVEDTSIIEDIRILTTDRVKISPAEQAIFNLRATSTLFALVNLACMRQDESEDAGERYVQKAEEYVRENFAKQMNLGDAATHAGVGYDHLRHLFRAKRGRSLVQYLTEVRVERAKTLLVHSRQPLNQIAELCGFRNEFYFSSVFRKLAGMPPGRYREKRS